jgi:hypothetical protein
VRLRRALLLFAIVLGLTAVAATLSQSSDPSNDSPLPAGTLTAPEPVVSGAPAQVRFEVSKRRKGTVIAGQAAEVYVEVDRPGQVVIPDLGLSAAAEPLTPARFDVLVTRPGRYEVYFVPVDETPDLKAGSLVVREGTRRSEHGRQPRVARQRPRRDRLDYKGFVWSEIEVTGQAAHGSGPRWAGMQS